jgi:hypothetical protein
VPKGVSVKIKRSRTIEHTVQLTLQSSTEGEVSVGFWDVLQSSIRAKLEEQHSREFRETETVEYEVELRGDVSTRFVPVHESRVTNVQSGIERRKHLSGASVDPDEAGKARVRRGQ